MPGQAPAAGEWTAVVSYGDRPVRVPARYRLVPGGDLLVLLHGLGCARDSFDGAFTAPPLQGTSLIAVDLPGHGQAAGDLPGCMATLACFAVTARDAVREITRHAGMQPARVHLAGHSMGGAVAVLLAGQSPPTGQVISIDGNLTGEDCGLVSRHIAAQDPRAFTAGGHEDLIADLRASGQPGPRAWARWLTRADPLAVHAAALSLVHWSESGKLLPRFNALPAKAFIYGDREDKRHVLQYLRDTRVETVPGAGHFPMTDAPGPFYAALARAVRGGRL